MKNKITTTPSIKQRKNITKEEAIASLVDFYSRNGKTPPQTEALKKDQLYALSTYLKVLNCRNWEEVLETAGLPRSRMGGGSITEKQAIESLQKFYIENGRVPTIKECKPMYGLYSPGAYKGIFDTRRWREVLEKGGLPYQVSRGRKKRLSEDELLAILKLQYLKNGKITPKIRQVKAASTIIYCFGNWPNALEKAGIPLIKGHIKSQAEDIQLITSIKEKNGSFFQEVRSNKKLSKCAIFKKTGLNIPLINAIEAGRTAYTIDSLLKYLYAIDTCILFREKSRSDNPADKSKQEIEYKEDCINEERLGNNSPNIVSLQEFFRNLIDISKKEIGTVLLKMRKQKKLSKNEVQRRTGLQAKIIMDIESGKPAYTIDSFLKYLNCIDTDLCFEAKDTYFRKK